MCAYEQFTTKTFVYLNIPSLDYNCFDMLQAKSEAHCFMVCAKRKSCRYLITTNVPTQGVFCGLFYVEPSFLQHLNVVPDRGLWTKTEFNATTLTQNHCASSFSSNLETSTSSASVQANGTDAPLTTPGEILTTETTTTPGDETTIGIQPTPPPPQCPGPFEQRSTGCFYVHALDWKK